MNIKILFLQCFMLILRKISDNHHNLKFCFFPLSLTLPLLFYLLVHNLKPADIRVIAALGDSLTVSKYHWITIVKASNEKAFLNF